MSGHKFFQVVRFMAGGSISVLVYYAILYTFTEYLDVWYIASSALGWILSYVVGFFVQKFWTFKNRSAGEASRQFRLYIIMAIGILVSNTTFLYIFVEYINLEYINAQLILSTLLTVASYCVTRKIFATN